jgi:[ribosomal protein S5]-alanine N-acetyltransferase
VIVPPDLIKASSVVLRRAQQHDAPSLFALAADPQVARYMDWPMPTNASSTKSHLEGASAKWDAGVEYQWIILDSQTEATVGTIALRVKGHAADFGYFIGRSFWGRGLAFDAATAVLQWIDTQSHILRIWATVDSENLRSRRLLERLGLRLEGVMRCATLRPNIGGPPRDTAIYARTKNDH